MRKSRTLKHFQQLTRVLTKHTWFWCLTSFFWCWKLMNRHHRRWKATKTKHDAVCCWLTNIDAGAWCGSRKVSNLGAGVAIIFICLKHNDILWTCFVAKISALNVLNVKFCVPNYGKVALHGKKKERKKKSNSLLPNKVNKFTFPQSKLQTCHVLCMRPRLPTTWECNNNIESLKFYHVSRKATNFFICIK